MNEIAILKGHTSPETAFVVEDYPYSFTLRCKIRFWLEWKNKKGFRLVSQTTNPKKAGEVWNAPKASTYSEIGVMVQYDEAEAKAAGVRSISWVGINAYNVHTELEPFVEKYQEAFTKEHWFMVEGFRAAIKRYNERKAAQGGAV